MLLESLQDVAHFLPLEFQNPDALSLSPGAEDCQRLSWGLWPVRHNTRVPLKFCPADNRTVRFALTSHNHTYFHIQSAFRRYHFSLFGTQSYYTALVSLELVMLISYVWKFTCLPISLCLLAARIKGQCCYAQLDFPLTYVLILVCVCVRVSAHIYMHLGHVDAQ